MNRTHRTSWIASYTRVSREVYDDGVRSNDLVHVFASFLSCLLSTINDDCAINDVNVEPIVERVGFILRIGSRRSKEHALSLDFI